MRMHAVWPLLAAGVCAGGEPMGLGLLVSVGAGAV